MKILVVVAHPDDAEYETSGLVALMLERGHDVTFLSVCNGCGGHHLLTPAEITARRAKESQRVAKLLGVTYDVWADQPDCAVVADLPTRRRLIRYIRTVNPDLIITHRPNDYHADHRNVGLLVQDASYMLIVPNECPDVPAMSKTPVIMFHGDNFKNPPFAPDLVVDIDSVIETKYRVLNENDSQVYEWLPYADHDTTPPPASQPEERMKWLIGADITNDTTDDEIVALTRGVGKLFAMPAVRYRRELIERYGEARGSRVRFAEAYQVCEYGAPLTDVMKAELFPF